MRYAHYLRTGLGTVATVLAIATFAGCARSTSSATSNTSTTSSKAVAPVSTAFNRADQAVGKHQIGEAIHILQKSSAAKQKNSAAQEFLANLQRYQKATKYLKANDLTSAGRQVTYLGNHPVTNSTNFPKAVTTLTSQYHAVKQADELYATAQDDMSTHDLNSAKTTIDQLDAIKPIHPVVRALQKRAVAFKEAIMNYEASQSTSSGSQSSEVQESSSQSTSSQSSANTSSADSTSSSQSTKASDADSSSDNSSSSSAKSSNSDTSSSASTQSAENNSAVLDQFKQQSGVSFKSGDQITIVKSGDHYQIDVRRNNATGDVANLQDSYRFWPSTGQVKQQDSQTGNYQSK